MPPVPFLCASLLRLPFPSVPLVPLLTFPISPSALEQSRQGPAQSSARPALLKEFPDVRIDSWFGRFWIRATQTKPFSVTLHLPHALFANFKIGKLQQTDARMIQHVGREDWDRVCLRVTKLNHVELFIDFVCDGRSSSCRATQGFEG